MISRAEQMQMCLTRWYDLGRFEESHATVTPMSLMNEILDQVSIQSKSTLVLFNIEWVIAALYERQGKQENLTFLSDHPNKTKFVEAMGVRVIDNSIHTKKKFDLVLGTAKPSEINTGTSRNTTSYKKFIDSSFKFRKKGGIVALVTQRNGINHAIKNHNVTILKEDTSEHWVFTAGWFISVGDNSDAKSMTSDSIISKTYDITIKKRFRHAIGGSYESNRRAGKFSDVEITNSVYGIVDTPKKDMPECKFAWITGTVTPAGPKLIFPAFRSKLGYVATDLPSYAGSTCTLFFDTLQEAKAAKLFVLNNPIITYLNKMLNEKSRGFIFRYVRPFDLSQIKTGFEIPKEFGLTQEEIAKISANIRQQIEVVNEC